MPAIPAPGYAYSFLDVLCAISGPGGSFPIGAGASVADEGITIDAEGPINTMTIGADGAPMHSLHASKGGHITIRLLKDSPTNAMLMELYNAQTTSGANHGQNTITLANNVAGDNITAQYVAFAKAPAFTYAKEGGMVEWTFDAGIIDRVIGQGVSLAT